MKRAYPIQENVGGHTKCLNGGGAHGALHEPGGLTGAHLGDAGVVQHGQHRAHVDDHRHALRMKVFIG